VSRFGGMRLQSKRGSPGTQNWGDAKTIEGEILATGKEWAGMSPNRRSPFSEMITAGERLMEAQRLENTINRLYSKHQTEQRLEQWKVAALPAALP
jgi:hypothetical protein